MNRDIYALIEKIIDKKVKGADTYINKGSRWLIFTDAKKWIFELTNEGTLWYNYYFFEKIFKLISLEVVKNQHHITKWVENAIQNGVKHTDACQIGTSTSIEDAIQNGVKNTQSGNGFIDFEVADIIQNGVKETKHNIWDAGLAMEEAIQNGVKETYGQKHKPLLLGDVIQNGVKETKYCELHSLMRADHIIRDGVKETNWRKVDNFPEFEERVIENGIKETWGYEKQPQIRVNEVINKGEKSIWSNDTTKL